jgi:hypothetical protein
VARYNVRDLIGHWVKPRSARGKMCPHACCRNRRVHPDNFPVILPAKLLRRVSDRDLEKQYERHGNNERARAQVIRELERRDKRDATRRTRAKAVGERQAAARMERESAAEGYYRAAEAATNGELVNRKGVARGVSTRRVLLGSEADALRYGTRELLDFRASHPKPSLRRQSAGQRARSRLYVGY